MAKKATPQDAQVIMKLYDLRREPELRKARDWWLTKFWPDTAEDFMKIAGELGSQENNWLRQVGGYWGMAAALVSSGAVSRDLFRFVQTFRHDDRSRVPDHVLLSVHVRFSARRDGPAWARTRALVS